MDDAPAGFPSEDARRRFNNRVGILTIANVAIQFIVPFVLLFQFFPVSILYGKMEITMPEVRTGTYWNGRIWFLARRISTDKPMERTLHLMSAPAEGDGDMETGPAVDGGKVSLVGGPDRLWLISSKSVQSYQKGELTTHTGQQDLYRISHAFLYGGRPAVIEFQSHGMSMQVFRDDYWEALEWRGLPIVRQVQANGVFPVSDGEEIGYFLTTNRALHYWSPRDDHAEVVRLSRSHMSVAMVNGRPMAVFLEGEGIAKTIVGMERTGSGWTTSFEMPAGFSFETHLLPHPDGESAALLSTGFPGSVKIRQIRGGSTESTVHVSGGFPIDRILDAAWIINLVTIFFMILYIPLMSATIRKYRSPEYTATGIPVPYASLTRRTVARIIDFFIMLAPLTACMIPFMAFFTGSGMELDAFLLWVLILGVGGSIWMLIWSLLLSFMEGRWGTSPGKALMGIQVLGEDLQPCGFGRGILRKLMFIADGLFSFLVGILVIAMSEKQQRIGDKLAKTIVVVRTKAPPPRPD